MSLRGEERRRVEGPDKRKDLINGGRAAEKPPKGPGKESLSAFAAPNQREPGPAGPPAFPGPYPGKREGFCLENPTPAPAPGAPPGLTSGSGGGGCPAAGGAK